MEGDIIGYPCINKRRSRNLLRTSRRRIKANPEAFSSSYEDIINKECAIEYKAQKLAQDENYTLGAFKDGKLIGVATLETKPYVKQEHKAKIGSVYVSPKARGLGAGKALIKECLELAKSLEVEQVMLDVVVGNDGAKNFMNH